MWKRIRIGILLAVLVVVAGNAWLERRRAVSWQQPLEVGIFPIAADDDLRTRDYVAGLTRAAFAPMEDFYAREARRHGLSLDRPFRVSLHGPVAAAPPAPPPSPGALGVVWWSLRMRYYAFREGQGRPPPHVRMFVLYHDPARSPVVPHSVGLAKGLIGVVHVFAAAPMDERNLVVIAHELLHTVGALDHYDAATDAPLYPDGYAEPERVPRFPQALTEIMAGRRALSETESEMPGSLATCVIGPATAREIHWISP